MPRPSATGILERGAEDGTEGGAAGAGTRHGGTKSKAMLPLGVLVRRLAGGTCGPEGLPPPPEPLAPFPERVSRRSLPVPLPEPLCEPLLPTPRSS